MNCTTSNTSISDVLIQGEEMKQQKRRTIGGINRVAWRLCNIASVCYTGLD
jgi:hypothetical protein